MRKILPFFFIRDKVTADKAFDVGRQERADDALPHFEAPCCSATLENSFHVLIARHMMSPSMKGEARPGIPKKKKKNKKESFLHPWLCAACHHMLRDASSCPALAAAESNLSATRGINKEQRAS